MTPEGVNVLAVECCSLDVRASEICMIVGPSGCGKTTLLNAIAGFHSITTGAIWLDGEMLCGPGKPKGAIFLGHRVAVMASRPARAKQVVEIDIPRPRDFNVLSSDHFRRLVAASRGIGPLRTPTSNSLC
jgi:ABC-type nitrate/sulfonate/bicarbonate transport system ATPase subunit